MPELIENRPVSCTICNAYPVYGTESRSETKTAIIDECRWICTRCGNLVRVDEKVTPKTSEK